MLFAVSFSFHVSVALLKWFDVGSGAIKCLFPPAEILLLFVLVSLQFDGEFLLLGGVAIFASTGLGLVGGVEIALLLEEVLEGYLHIIDVGEILGELDIHGGGVGLIDRDPCE